MNKTIIEVLHIAVLIGVLIEFIFDIIFFRQLNILAVAVILFSGYFLYTKNELFWSLIEKYRGGSQ